VVRPTTTANNSTGDSSEKFLALLQRNIGRLATEIYHLLKI
jgi:hypothetical protein